MQSSKDLPLEEFKSYLEEVKDPLSSWLDSKVAMHNSPVRIEMGCCDHVAREHSH